jgi:hypothetical protein
MADSLITLEADRVLSVLDKTIDKISALARLHYALFNSQIPLEQYLDPATSDILRQFHAARIKFEDATLDLREARSAAATTSKSKSSSSVKPRESKKVRAAQQKLLLADSQFRNIISLTATRLVDPAAVASHALRPTPALRSADGSAPPEDARTADSPHISAAVISSQLAQFTAVMQDQAAEARLSAAAGLASSVDAGAATLIDEEEASSRLPHLVAALRDLRRITDTHMHTSVTEARSRSQTVTELSARERRMNASTQSLRRELRVARQLREQEAAELETTAAEAKTKVRTVASSGAAQVRTVGDYYRSVSSEEVSRHDKTVTEAEARLADLRERLAKISADFSEQEALLRKRAARTQTELAARVAEYDEEVGRRDARIIALKERLASLGAEKETLAARLAVLDQGRIADEAVLAAAEEVVAAARRRKEVYWMAARRIQATWRGFAARKAFTALKKKGKKGKKGLFLSMFPPQTGIALTHNFQVPRERRAKRARSKLQMSRLSVAWGAVKMVSADV